MASGTEAPRLLVVEDDPAIRESLATTLSEEAYQVTAVATVHDARRESTRTPPDLALVDLGLPDGDGVGLVRWLRSHLDTPTIVLTGRDRFADKAAGFDAGADDYLTKPFQLGELLLRIRALLHRTGSPARPITVGDLTVEPDAHRATRRDITLELTATEFALLAALARHRGHTLTHSQLLTHVWGDDAHRDPRLVAKHLSTLRRKLDAHGPPLITTVHRVGYRLQAPT